MNREMQYTINGDEPNILGRKCEGFVLSQIQESLRITDPANVVYLKFTGDWFRLYFDGDTIFWRKDEEISLDPVNSNIDCCTTILNLNEMDGVVGFTLESIDYNSSEVGVSVKLIFLQGKILEFAHDGNQDVTQLKC